MQVTLKLAGETALVMHNERMADPLDPFKIAVAEITGKRKKTIPDHEEIGRLEFFGGLYTEPPLDFPLTGEKCEPSIPAWNILRCLQDGGKRFKRGVDVPRGIHPLTENAKLLYEGPSDPEALWKDGGFSLRKTVGVQKSRMMRTRPIFPEWSAELPIEVDSLIFNLEDLRLIWAAAGTYAGLGEMRPVFGRFIATIEEKA